MARIRIYGLLLCAALILAAVLSGCDGKNSIPDYRDTPFSATVEWMAGELLIVAQVEADLQGSLKIELIEPEELSGIRLLSEGERRRILCGETELNGESMAPLFETVGLLLPVGERRVICETEWEGERVMYAEIEGVKRVELYLKPDSGVPVGLVCGDRALRVRSFEIGSSEGETP